MLVFEDDVRVIGAFILEKVPAPGAIYHLGHH